MFTCYKSKLNDIYQQTNILAVREPLLQAFGKSFEHLFPDNISSWMKWEMGDDEKF